MTRTRKWLLVFAIILTLVGSAFHYCFVGRVERQVAAQDWLLHFSYTRFGCPLCTGRVERLEYRGRPIAIPAVATDDDGRSRRLAMSSPVGRFELWNPPVGWFRRDHEFPRSELPESVTAEDIRRGYYRLAGIFDKQDPGPRHKHGTPGHWCVIWYTDSGDGWWISPELVGQAPWAADDE